MKKPTSLADLRRQGRMKIVGFLGLLVISGILASIPGKQSTDNATPEVKPVISENDAMASCQARTRAAAKFPSSVNFSVFGAAVQTLNDGAVLVRLDFEAKNGFGNVLPQRALCKFLPSGESLFSIEDR
ncbi:hypothetical protein [Achromobacter veterisilvae]|uniref:hypothetical protein n=1 Tax=Achromobacter veterisilvae TaxID=2069367 RepID=UPI00100EB344|nr:hypothetical protein [Achromobacter veterisilvae]